MSERDDLRRLIVGDGETRVDSYDAADRILAAGWRPIPAEVADALRALPPGPWTTWTSCSFRRITGPDGIDGGVLHALNQRGDGHPDLSWSERECEAICTVVNALRAALIPE